MSSSSSSAAAAAAANPFQGVIESVFSELSYQRDKSGGWEHRNAPSIEAEILMMEEYLAKVRREYTSNRGGEKSLEQLRKVVAMGFRCMKNHGAPMRVQE
jgi:hypothetical protein